MDNEGGRTAEPKATTRRMYVAYGQRSAIMHNRKRVEPLLLFKLYDPRSGRCTTPHSSSSVRFFLPENSNSEYLAYAKNAEGMATSCPI